MRETETDKERERDAQGEKERVGEIERERNEGEERGYSDGNVLKFHKCCVPIVRKAY